MVVYTIGFTKRSAADFFGALRGAGIAQLLDVRLHNVSQLAGYSKRDDLAFFLRELCSASYVHEPLLAPSEDLLGAYRAKRLSWPAYEQSFVALLTERRIERTLTPELFSTPTVLLCSEPTAEHCHRRLVLEYLQRAWGNVDVVHLQ